MENISNENPSKKWLSVPLIATVTRLLCRELTLQNEYLRQENKILKSKIKKRISTKFLSRLDRLEAHLVKDTDFDNKVDTALPQVWLGFVQDDTPIILDLSGYKLAKEYRAKYRKLLSKVKKQIKFLKGTLRGKEPV